MKKRLLALALCLVMATSLLPVTALADSPYPIFSGLEDIETYCGEVQFSVSVEGDVGTVIVHYNIPPNGPFNIINADGDGKYTLPGGFDWVRVEAINRIGPTDFTNAIHVIVNNGQHTWTGGTPVGNGKHSRSCSNCPATKTEDCVDADRDHECDVCKASVHTWQFKAAGNTLTGTCGGANCDIREVSVSLVAHSVTLPNSPFNARLEGWEAFKQAVPSAYYNSFDYKLNGEDVTDQSNPKAGNYQVGVRIYGLPGNVEYEGVASRADMNSAYLFTQYTAADPKVTAQTGDNRPIELMLGSVLVFSALAAAAFIVDSKRRSQP